MTFRGLDPLEWVKAAGEWFRRTEKTSGFRPYLIFLFLLFTFSLAGLFFFAANPALMNIIFGMLGLSVTGFVVLYFIKAIYDPEFCRSERHVERLSAQRNLIEQKGDMEPRVISQEVDRLNVNPEALNDRLATSAGGEK